MKPEDTVASTPLVESSDSAMKKAKYAQQIVVMTWMTRSECCFSSAQRPITKTAAYPNKAPHSTDVMVICAKNVTTL